MQTSTSTQKLIIKKRAVKSYSTTKFPDETMLTTNPTSISVSSSFF
jgi:hypothetical protein